MFLHEETFTGQRRAMKVEKELLKAVVAIARQSDNLEELDLFFQEIFTPGELADLSLRWKLLTDLDRGMTQRKIAEKYGISLCKITRGSKILKKKNSIVFKILRQAVKAVDKGEKIDTRK
ncbi:putative repressor TrpR (repressor of Trp operon) [Desulforapulum autotrophicum HRM2]|uniref:Repressor TrpR (Repressor of Trp operon) n=2 Tax=Desulforapulum autotrophicum TaxID=2296 RepID=C0QDI0_DESAH|nr:putative repressor TrpR (repressor of Trp operon) [Desulforapulum autotrophicum HRM2]